MDKSERKIIVEAVELVELSLWNNLMLGQIQTKETRPKPKKNLMKLLKMQENIHIEKLTKAQLVKLIVENNQLLQQTQQKLLELDVDITEDFTKEETIEDIMKDSILNIMEECNCDEAEALKLFWEYSPPRGL